MPHPRTRRATVAALALGTVSLGLSSCGNDASGSSTGCEHTYTIGFSHPVNEAAFVKMMEGLKQK